MIPRRGPGGRSAALAVLVGALACSTLADTPAPEECRNDDDCPAGSVCAVDQGRCLPGNEAAPRAHLGFDIRESVAGTVLFRVEVDGCDCTIEEEENIRELALRRSRVTQELDLTALVSESPSDPEVEDALLTARFEITQPSRHAQGPHAASIDHPTYAEAVDTPMVVDTVLEWPRYHPLDQDLPPDLLLWEVEPEGDLASRYLGLLPPRTDADKPCEVDADCCEPQGDCSPAPNYCETMVGECTAVGRPKWFYDFTYNPSCSRILEGTVVTLDVDPEQGNPPLPGTSVSLRYADAEVEDEVQRLGIPVLATLGPACEDDGDCDGPDLFCDPVQARCVLALAGRPAAKGNPTTDEAGHFTAPVYTYCDSQPNTEHTRRYELTVQATGPRPTVEYLVDATFAPIQDAGFTIVGGLCVPDWGVGAPLELALVGQPRALAGSDGEYTCCDVDCLPSTATDAVAGAPPAPETCDGRSSGIEPFVELETEFVLDDLGPWLDAECAMPNLDGQLRAGSLVRKAECDQAGQPCRAEDLALGTAEADRRYRVRFESEPGSVLASGDFIVDLGPEAPPRHDLMLSPRVLVTGVVDVDPAVCARRPTGEDCAAREAVVLAERLRLPGETDGSVPGPYLHDVSTFYDPVAGRDGAFVLPLDPGGVYVVTALPLAGAEGGPAGYTLVDLRESSTLEPLRLVLEDGVVVTLRLEQFDQRATVIPLDRGSHLAPGKTLILPGTDRPIDLDEIGACWTPALDGPRACKIRRLIPPGPDLARNQVGVVRFTARRSDDAQCSVRCPTAPPTE